MEAKFTPGPWSISLDGDDFDVVHDDLNAVVCSMTYSIMLGDRLRPLPNAEANAALIAAAPDLYEALEKLASITMHYEAEHAQAMRALKKARGET